MPIRDYKCDKCDYEWEELRKDQTDPSFCPKCENLNVKRLLSKNSGFILKGTGWYKTGYDGGKNG